jgi:hemerythrin-like domain-containing protein
MKTDITDALVREHRLIKRMLTLLEERARLTERGEYRDWMFYLNGVDFIRSYADRFHHAKEEDVLFEALVRNGMPRENSPVAAMLLEHNHGRGFVRGMEKAAKLALSGDIGAEKELAVNALAYVELLREHIDKEDDILYPLAERVIPEEMRHEIVARYARAEGETAEGLELRYEELVAGYEAEKIPPAA